VLGGSWWQLVARGGKLGNSCSSFLKVFGHYFSFTTYLCNLVNSVILGDITGLLGHTR
jgi:hypothetical protein